MFGTGFEIIAHSHSAGMCVLASYCTAVNTYRD